MSLARHLARQNFVTQNLGGLAWNTSVQIAGKVIGTLLGVAALALVTRILGPEGFGAYSTVNAFLQVFGVVVDFGLVLTTVTLVSAPGVDMKKVFANLITLRVVSALVVFSAALGVAWLFPYPLLVKQGIALLSISFFLITLNQILMGLYQKHLRMSRVVVAELAGRCVLILGLALTWWYSFGLFAVLGAVVASTTTHFVLMAKGARQWVAFRFAWDYSLWRKILARAWPIGVSIIFNLLYLHMGVVVLSLVKPAYEVGLYGAAFRVLEVMLSVPMMVMGLMLPLLVHTWEQGDRTAFQVHINRAMLILAALGIPFAVGTYFTATPLMTLVAGSEFAASGAILTVLGVAVMSICFSAIFTHAVVALHRQRTMLWGFALAAGVAAVGYAVLIPVYGGLGVAYSTLLAELVVLVYSFVLVHRTVDYMPQFTTLIKILGATALMATVLMLLRGQHVLVMVGAGVVWYGVGLCITRAVTLSDVEKMWWADTKI